MKKLLVFSLLLSSYGMAQKKMGYVQKRMHDIQLEKSYDISEKTFKESSVSQSIPTSLQNVVSQATFFKVDELKANEIAKSANNVVRLSFPVGNEMIDVLVEKVSPFAKDFRVTTGNNPNEAYNYRSRCTHYRGVVIGDDYSLVALTISNDQITGLIGSGNKNYVIGKLDNDAQNRHVIYDDHDLLIENPIECNTEDAVTLPYSESELNYSSAKSLSDCLRIYVEVDKSIFDNKGSVTATADFVAGIFNEVTTLYANENINLVVSEVKIWDTEDPYPAGNNSGFYLDKVKEENPTFNGDLCALLSFHGGGGLAWVNTLCGSFTYSYNGIGTTFSTFPTYSWTVKVVTHEIGHNLGSGHTHDCIWNGNSTQIDDCGNVQLNSTVSCYDSDNPIIPSQGGTIMSYCQNNPVGINYNEGFGEQPGNLIRSRVDNASCLEPCDNPGGDYCESQGNNSSFEWIESATVGNLNNVSGNNGGYADFTNTIVNLEQGETVNVNLAPGFSGTLYSEYWKIWIDLNQNGEFESNEELFSEDNTQTNASGTLTIPTTAAIGQTRMRISMKWDAAQTPCEAFSYGEVEDYTVNIKKPICASKGEKTVDEWIQTAVIGNINNNSGDNGGYEDFTNISLNVNQGQNVAVSLTPGYTNTVYTEHWVIWIDFNNDGDFNDSGEEVFYQSGTTPVSGSFTIPSSTITGSCTMRVSMKYNSKPTPCETFTYGEVEDYNVNIGAGDSQGDFVAIESNPIEFSAYPNPTKGKLNVDFNTEMEGDINMIVYSMTGAKVLEVTDKNIGSRLVLDVSKVENGTYLLVVNTKNETFTQRISVLK